METLVWGPFRYDRGILTDKVYLVRQEHGYIWGRVGHIAGMIAFRVEDQVAERMVATGILKPIKNTTTGPPS